MAVFKDDRLEIAADMHRLFHIETAPNGKSYSLSMIGRMFEVSPTTVSTMIKEAGVTILNQLNMTDRKKFNAWVKACPVPILMLADCEVHVRLPDED